MDEQTIQAYNELAKVYDDETKYFWDSFPQTIINAFCGIAHGKILDIGSGPGRDALLLRRYGFDVTCLDASEEMVNLSSGNGFDSMLGDFNSLPFPDGSFDGVWAYTSLLHIKKSEIGRPLAEIRRVLKNGGAFCLGMVEGDIEHYRKSSEMEKLRWFSFYQKNELEDLLCQNGFEIVYFEQFQPKTKNYLNFICRKI
jgi:ubiquinone/menaquinone biosynthesis C-methylase UbiE